MKLKELSKTDKPFFTFASAFFLCLLLPEYLAPVMTAVCLFKCIKKSEIKNIGYIGKTIIAIIGLMIICSFYSSNAISSLASIALWTFMFTGYFSALSVVKSREKIEILMFTGCVAAGICGVIAIVQMMIFHIDNGTVGNLFNPFWHWLDLLAEKTVNVLPEFVKNRMSSKTFHTFNTRACSTFSNPLFFATLEVTLLPFAAYEYLCSNDKKRTITGLICFASSLFGIALSYSRGPYMYAVIVVFILLLYGGKKTLVLIATGSGGLLTLFVFAKGTFLRLITLMNKKNVSVSTRKRVWNAVFDMIKKRPVFGYGTGFDNVRSALHETYGIMQPHAHNIFFEAYLENGVLGATLLAALFGVSFFEMIVVSVKNKEYRYIAVTMIASVAGFMMCGMTDCVFYGLKPLQFLMMLLGLIQAIYFTALSENTN